jgi:hypothetical protein
MLNVQQLHVIETRSSIITHNNFHLEQPAFLPLLQGKFRNKKRATINRSFDSYHEFLFFKPDEPEPSSCHRSIGNGTLAFECDAYPRPLSFAVTLQSFLRSLGLDTPTVMTLKVTSTTGLISYGELPKQVAVTYNVIDDEGTETEMVVLHQPWLTSHLIVPGKVL